MRWFKRFAIVSILAAVVVFEWRTLRHHRLSKQSPDEISTDAAEQGGEVLQKRIDLTASNFGEAIKELSAKSGSRIEPNWNALETSGINSDAPCNVRLQNVTLALASEFVLVDVGGGTVSLAFKCKDGVIHVSTRRTLNSEL